MATAILLLCAALGVDAGWQKRPDGGYDYIIQIEPQLLQSLLEDKRELASEIPPQLQDVRGYRIRVGDEPLPRDAPEPVHHHGGGAAPQAEQVPPAEQQGEATTPATKAPALPTVETTAALPTAAAGDARRNRLAQPSTPSAAQVAVARQTEGQRPAPQQAGQHAVQYRGDASIQTAGGQPPQAASPLLARIQRWTSPGNASHAWLLPALVLALVLSLAANLFLSWITWDQRARFRSRLRGLMSAAAED
jgi:hypothetical protein